MNENNVSIESANDISISLSKPKKVFYLFIKRLFDIIFSLIGMVFLIPMSLIIKIITMCSGDFHSIFYTQNRVGKNGKIFKLYKYRSMVYDADKKLKEVLKQKVYREQWEKFQKLDPDPRITKIGGLLRKLSLDEMPQFLNIIKGDLSLIGPRPLVPGELKAHYGDPKIYESVKPGITGWWAVNGRSATTYKKRLELEYYYVKNMGFKLDIQCIFKTIKVIFTRSGAK